MGMYEQAHWVVKAVMIALLIASFVTWTVLVFKTVEMMVAKARLRRATRALLRGDSYFEGLVDGVRGVQPTTAAPADVPDDAGEPAADADVVPAPSR